MKCIETSIPDVKIFQPRMFGDERGYFMETWNALSYSEYGVPEKFVQDNLSVSKRGTVRGLHYQIEQAQGKLVRVQRGSVFDVAIDMRRSSPTFGRSVSVVLSGENKLVFWVPPGFAHGFLSLQDGTEFAYKCTNFYAPEHERTLLWNDPVLNIEWPVEGLDLELSAKDQSGLPFAHAEAFP